jgi:hypothetical protein
LLRAKKQKTVLAISRNGTAMDPGSPRAMAEGMGCCDKAGANNETIRDYVLLPSESLSVTGPLLVFRGHAPAHRIERFETFDGCLGRSSNAFVTRPDAGP